MSHTPQQPADGWQPPQQQPPVYRPNEQPPQEDPPPWSPESQRMAQPGQGPVEEDGTVKYVGGPGHQSPQQFGPPPGVPVSPFDAPPQQAFQQGGAPQQFQASPPQQQFQASPPPPQAADPFGPSGGFPVSGMPVSGMPPVSSIPASGMPVSGVPVSGPGVPGQPPFGGGQFGPQGGQLVPVSGGGAQPWGAPDTIQRKNKKGGKGPMVLLVVGIVVIAAALGVGGFILFNPSDTPSDDPTGAAQSSAGASSEASGDPTEEAQAPAATTVLADEASGLSILTPEGSTEATTPPGGLTAPTGTVLGGNGPTVYFGVIDAAAVGANADANLNDIGKNLQGLAATWAGGTATDPKASQYRVDSRAAQFRTFTVGDLTVMTAVVQNGGSLVGFVGSATADQVEALEAARSSLSFGS